ncbi:CaiB/BaiF CoA transferase family protein [Flavimaricola marinus]|uniref:Formyl-coenzyme A transferase n=1 Tax=Flavimaricola marinus TaxID=1819565 RepID=A0A238LKC9_9RHOB|nr:CoA transferase [Flavimaricola marinus]SMY09993.1 Formyl-coenzyme A transferase [Flavimaricola marinus]
MSWQRVDWAPNSTGPLTGVRVLDASRLVAGNMCSLQMADFGADVVKVEPLPSGDPLRAWAQRGVSTFWKAYARNKRSVGLDFRADGAVPLLGRLIEQADVFIENFRPGTLEKMGLAPEDLIARHPGLIVLRVSGFGQTGPYAPRPGFGTLVEGMSGFASRNGMADGPPLLPPLALADMIAGLYGANAVAMALRARDQSGRGQIIDLALLDAMTSVLGPEAMDYALTSKVKPRVGNASNTAAPRNAYRSSDGQFIVVSGSMQSMAERLFTAIGRADLISDPRFVSNAKRLENRDALDAIIGDWFAKISRAEALDILGAAGVTACPLNDIADIADDIHFRDRGLYVEVPDADLGHAAIHGPLPRLSATPGSLRSPAPTLGEHTDAVLAECGLSPAEIAAARGMGLVA